MDRASARKRLPTYALIEQRTPCDDPLRTLLDTLAVWTTARDRDGRP